MKLIQIPTRPRQCLQRFSNATCRRQRLPGHQPQQQQQHIRPLSTTSTRQSILGVDRVSHWAVTRPAPRPRTRVELAINRARAASDPDRIKVFPCTIPSARAQCKDPIATITASQLSVLDPTGVRARLFNKTNNDGAKVGDILLVRTKEGDPFAGVCIDIRRRGIDTAILLRDQATRVGVEMWYKVFSPNVEGVEIVQRRAKRARRARLYYMRQPKHDFGSTQNIVQQYLRQRQVLRSGGQDNRGRDGTSKRKGKRK